MYILAFWCGCDEEQMDRIFRTTGLMRDKWDRKQAGTTYGAISIRNAVNSCAAVYTPVNAQDIVDEEFSKLDEEDYIEFQPDLSKITVTLEEMAPHTNARYGRNEIGMGNMFADYFKQIARYNSERKGWYVYDGSVWRPDKGNLKVSELAKLLADKLYVFALTITEEDARKRFIDRVRKLQLRKNRETMLKDAMSVYPISMQAFDRNKYLFNCKNGTLDMRTLEFREHRPDDYLTMESGITYDPNADCPRWHSFIQEVMCGDKDLADFLQRSLGYALTGDTSQECMFILYGATSRNGKGTAIPFVQSIHKVNNKQQDKHIEAQVWGEASDKTPVYAADVIVTYQVLPEKSAWLYANVSDIKNLVGDELVASAIKSAMAELGPNEVTNRTKIEPLAQQKLAESLVQKYGEDVVFVNKVVINDMNFEDAYNEAIQQKSIAQQNADKQKIENEAAIAKAEADKQVAITNAEAEAQKTSIAADAQAEANRKLAESLSDTLIDYQKIQKWDGKLPTVSGGNALVSIDPAE